MSKKKTTNTQARLFNGTSFVRLISAKEAHSRCFPSEYSLRCNGRYLDSDGVEKWCDCPVFPYFRKHLGSYVKTEYRYYFKEYPIHDDGEGPGFEGKDGLPKGHNPKCPFNGENNASSSQSVLASYHVDDDTITEAIMHQIRQAKREKEAIPDRLRNGPTGDDGTSDDGQYKNYVLVETMSTQKKRLLTVGSLLNYGRKVEMRDDIMTESNFLQFRDGSLDGEGSTVFMAGICDEYGLVRNAIREQHRELMDSIILSDCFVHDDPALGDTILFLLNDCLPKGNAEEIGGQKRKAFTSLKGFIFKDYAPRIVDGEEVSRRFFTCEHGPYFALMCNWRKINLVVDGRPRIAFAGDIYRLKGDIDYIDSEELSGTSRLLRNWDRSRENNR